MSSPSDPFVQDSQILTERQKEMIERQRLSGGLFANMGAPSSSRDAPPSPIDVRSDMPSIDELPTRDTRATPLRALAQMGPMDAFPGSSPTPHARRSSQKIVSDDTDIATPTAVRTVRVADDDDELGSSPPRFDENSAVRSRRPLSPAAESFDSHRPSPFYSASFDDGTTMDEEALAAAVTLAEEAESEQLRGYHESNDEIMSDLPSSTIDLELTAQIDADMQIAEGTAELDDTVPESNNIFMDAASHPATQDEPVTLDGSDTEVEPTSKQARTRKSKKTDTSSTSRVEDSFNSTPGQGTPGSRGARRSTRHSMESPIHIELGRVKRQKKPRRKNKESNGEDSPASPQLLQQDQYDHDRDPAIAASPTENTRSAKKRKSMNESPTTSDTIMGSPSTGRKRSIRRSQSNLSQVESAADTVKDTPAPSKRARQSLNMDVSEAKSTPPSQPKEAQSSQSKRISHVQVTPRHIKAPALTEQIAASIATVTETAPVTRRPALAQSQIQAQEQTPTGSATPSRSFAERVILTPRSIINKLKEIKNYFLAAPGLTVTRAEEREMADVLFAIQRRVHTAAPPDEDELM